MLIFQKYFIFPVFWDDFNVCLSSDHHFPSMKHFYSFIPACSWKLPLRLTLRGNVRARVCWVMSKFITTNRTRQLPPHARSEQHQLARARGPAGPCDVCLLFCLSLPSIIPHIRPSRHPAAADGDEDRCCCPRSGRGSPARSGISGRTRSCSL